MLANIRPVTLMTDKQEFITYEISEFCRTHHLTWQTMYKNRDKGVIGKQSKLNCGWEIKTISDVF